MNQKKYVATRTDGEVFVVYRETHEPGAGDDEGVESELLCRELFSVFRGTLNECRSYVSSLARDGDDDEVFSFERAPMVVPTGVTLEMSAQVKTRSRK